MLDFNSEHEGHIDGFDDLLDASSCNWFCEWLGIRFPHNCVQRLAEVSLEHVVLL